MDSFNFPNYLPSPSEVEHEILKEGSFTIHSLQLCEVNWKGYNDDKIDQSEALAVVDDGGNNLAKCLRSVTEPLIAAHFGEAVVEDIFWRYEELIANTMSEGEQELNVTISVIRKA